MNRINWYVGAASTLVFLGGCTIIVDLDQEHALETPEWWIPMEEHVISCMQASDCPEPIDKRCGTAVCDDGICGIAITSWILASQRAGDCKRAVCTFEGMVVEQDDPWDVYDDGAECTFDVCAGGVPVNLSILKVACPVEGEGYCLDSEHAQCIDRNACIPEDVCDSYISSYKYAPPTCFDDVKDGTETDVSCGGLCAGCSAGKMCNAGSDCDSGVCASGTCKEPTCDDGVKNSGETDVDCGRGCAGRLCADGKGCEVAANCGSRVCWAGRCQAPTCTDGVENGDETGVDCGGPCSDC